VSSSSLLADALLRLALQFSTGSPTATRSRTTRLLSKTVRLVSLHLSARLRAPPLTRRSLAAIRNPNGTFQWSADEDARLLQALANVCTPIGTAPIDDTELRDPSTYNVHVSRWPDVQVEYEALGRSSSSALAGSTSAPALPRTAGALHGRLVKLQRAGGSRRGGCPSEDGPQAGPPWSSRELDALLRTAHKLGGDPTMEHAGWAEGVEGVPKWVLVRAAIGAQRSVREVMRAWRENKGVGASSSLFIMLTCSSR